jgi:outer membrane protein TolC
LFSQVHFSSLADVLKYADKNSTVAREGDIQRAISDEDAGIVRSGLLPKLNAFGSAEYSPLIASQVIPESLFGGQDGKFRKVQFGMPWNVSMGVELTVPLINLEKWAQLEKTKLQAVEISWSQKTKLENLHIAIIQSYYHALVAKEMMRVNAENIKVVDELMRILEERKRNGILDPADYNRSQNLRLNVETARQDYKKLWEQSIISLRSLLNISPAVPFVLKDSITGFEWPLNDYSNIKTEQRPAWKASVARADVARQYLVESRRAGLPRLSLSSRYVYNWQMNKTQNIHFDVNTIGLRLDYTLFNGGYHRRQQKKADLLLQSAFVQQQQTGSHLVQQQQEWWNGYTTAFAKKKILENKVNAATDNLRIATLNVKEGVMEFDIFNNIFSEYTRAQIEQMQNLSDGIIYHLLLTNNIQ